MLGRTVRELLDTMSYPELTQWAEFMQIDPEPEWRADVRAAQICSTLANINRDDKKRPEPYGILDFMLFGKPKEAPPSEEASEGAKIAPETIAWLFAAAAKGK